MRTKYRGLGGDGRRVFFPECELCGSGQRLIGWPHTHSKLAFYVCALLSLRVVDILFPLCCVLPFVSACMYCVCCVFLCFRRDHSCLDWDPGTDQTDGFALTQDNTLRYDTT